MAADGGQAQALIQLDSPASRILQTAYDAHHGQLGELEPFRNLVRSNDLSTDQLMLLHSGLKAPPLHLQNLAGHAEFGRFLALCAELNLTQAEADDLRAFFLGTQLTLDQLDELCQVVLDKAITAETLRAIQFIFANKAATDDAQRLFRQFLVCLALDHNVPEAELTHYEAPAGPTDAGVVQILCWPQMPQEQSQPFADLWQNDVCRRISFLKKLLPSWQKHLAIDLVPKRKRTPADGARSNEAIFGDDPLLGVYLELARQLVDLALYQPGHAGRVRGIFIWEGFVRQWFDATCGGGDMITLNGTTWLIYRPYHPSSLWRHASIEILQEHVEMFQAAASDLDFTINTNKLEDWLRNRPEQLVVGRSDDQIYGEALTGPAGGSARETAAQHNAPYAGLQRWTWSARGSSNYLAFESRRVQDNQGSYNGG